VIAKKKAKINQLKLQKNYEVESINQPNYQAPEKSHATK